MTCETDLTHLLFPMDLVPNACFFCSNPLKRSENRKVFYFPGLEKRWDGNKWVNKILRSELLASSSSHLSVKTLPKTIILKDHKTAFYRYDLDNRVIGRRGVVVITTAQLQVLRGFKSYPTVVPSENKADRLIEIHH